MNDFVFLHGLESSPLGTKSVFLKSQFSNCIVPELPPDITKRNEILLTLIRKPIVIVGSSLGGLSALIFAMEKPDLVKSLILLAPAVGFFDSSLFDEPTMARIKRTYVPRGKECTIIAGKNDDVIPLREIKNLILRSPDKDKINLLTVDDNHSLNQSLDLLLIHVKKHFKKQ